MFGANYSYAQTPAPTPPADVAQVQSPSSPPLAETPSTPAVPSDERQLDSESQATPNTEPSAPAEPAPTPSPQTAPEEPSSAAREPDAPTVSSEEPPPPVVQEEARESLLTQFTPDVHAFVSQGFMYSTANNYLADSGRGSFEFTEVGLNFTKNISDRLRVGMQLFMRDLGPIGNYKPQFDWFYLDYRFFEWLGLRAGRTKIPFGLYNEFNDIDAGRLPILLPQSMYPTTARDYLLAQTGAEVYGLLHLGALGSLDYRAYGGTIYIDTASNQSIKELRIPYNVGGRLMWSTPLDGLQLGGTVQATSLEGVVALDEETLQDAIDAGSLPADSDGRVAMKLPAILWAASLEYSIDSLSLAAEYGRWLLELETNAPALYPKMTTESERMYVLASYRFAPWLQVGGYYSFYLANMARRSGRDAAQHDAAFTVRFDVSENFLLKLEGHYMHGTASLDPQLNGGTSRAALVEDWGLFLAKTTAYF
jgi:hypothetical protein